MRAWWKGAASAILGALTLAACSSTVAPNTHEFEQFRFSCCAGAALDTAWHPGDDVALRWTVEGAGTTTDPAGTSITLTAELSGPFASVAALKGAGAGPETLIAAPLHPSDRNPGSPVSTIALPANLAAGWYDLVCSVNAGSGNRVSGASVIRVTTALMAHT
jgi:hypothetical protein